MRVLLRKGFEMLQQGDDAAQRLIGSLRHGEFIAADIKRPRNLGHHRKFWALMELVARNQKYYASAEQVCAAFKVAVGHADYVKTKRGMIGIPKSISFANMDQSEFEAFYSKAVEYLTTEVIPGLNKDALRSEVEEMLT